MREKLSFYIPRDSFLHRLNPLTKLTLVLAMILIAFFSPWYWTATILIVFAIVLSFVGKVQREYFEVAVRLLVPVVGFLFLLQSLFYVYGTHVIFRFLFLHPTWENVQHAYLNASRIFVMVSSFILLLLSTHPSELMGDLTHRGLPAQIAYVITTTLQILPHMQAKAATIIDAQRSRGLETEGSPRKRIGALLPLVGPLVFGSLEEVSERAVAIEARAFMSPLRKTSLREIPDTSFDKSARWVMLMLILLALIGKLWLS